MRRKNKVIELARRKNGREFDKLIERTPTQIADIEKIRKTTRKLKYSMVKETSD